MPAPAIAYPAPPVKCPPRRFLRVDARRVRRSGRLWVGTVLLAAMLFELALPGLAYGLHHIGDSDAPADAPTASAPLRQGTTRADAARAASKTDATARTCCGKCCCPADQRNGGKCCCAGSVKPRPVSGRSDRPERRTGGDGGPAITCHCGHSPSTVGSAPDMPKFCGRPAAMTAPAPIAQPIGVARPRLCCADLAPETPPPKPKPLA